MPRPVNPDCLQYSRTFKNRPAKRPVFECVQFSNVRYSDRDCLVPFSNGQSSTQTCNCSLNIPIPNHLITDQCNILLNCHHNFLLGFSEKFFETLNEIRIAIFRMLLIEMQLKQIQLIFYNCKTFRMLLIKIQLEPKRTDSIKLTQLFHAAVS